MFTEKKNKCRQNFTLKYKPYLKDPSDKRAIPNNHCQSGKLTTEKDIAVSLEQVLLVLCCGEASVLWRNLTRFKSIAFNGYLINKLYL